MKIQFIFNPLMQQYRFAEVNEGTWPPMGALYLAAYLRSKWKDLEFRINDGMLLTYERIRKEINSYVPDILFVSYYSPYAPTAYALIDEVKTAFPNCLVLVGGTHATAFPTEALELSRADASVIGEGEQTSAEIVGMFRGTKRPDKMIWQEIDGVCYKEKGEIVRTPTRQFIKDLNTLPFPARDLVDFSKYRGWYIYKKRPETVLLSGRGCLYRCTFCSNQVWKTAKPYLRLRSPENVVDEIEEMMRLHGIKEIFDSTDEFNNNRNNAIGICEEILKRKIDLPWKTQIRANNVTEELVAVMARSGCWYVALGIESGNPEALKGIRKQITLEQVIDACQLLKKYNFKILGLFMLFNAWTEKGELRYEDVEMSKNTLKFAERMVKQGLLDYIGCTVATPYPGSELYDIAIRYKLIKEKFIKDWNAWLKDDLFLMELPGINRKQQIRLKTKASLLQARCLLKSGNIGIKDIGYYAKKSLRVVYDETFGRFKTF